MTLRAIAGRSHTMGVAAVSDRDAWQVIPEPGTH